MKNTTLQNKKSATLKSKNCTTRINIVTLYPGFSYKNSKGEKIVPEKLVSL
ncbi:hypothetical protein ACFQ5N_00030 [Lutibacter holmesii]|uniref:Uncharacterized protein n=1 Tax=Lutibacter holmesii TaxID=1137985 RepID=A0ABW3WKK8_9FLAO